MASRALKLRVLRHAKDLELARRARVLVEPELPTAVVVAVDPRARRGSVVGRGVDRVFWFQVAFGVWASIGVLADLLAGRVF